MKTASFLILCWRLSGNTDTGDAFFQLVYEELHVYNRPFLVARILKDRHWLRERDTFGVALIQYPDAPELPGPILFGLP